MKNRLKETQKILFEKKEERSRGRIEVNKHSILPSKVSQGINKFQAKKEKRISIKKRPEFKNQGVRGKAHSQKIPSKKPYFESPKHRTITRIRLLSTVPSYTEDETEERERRKIPLCKAVVKFGKVKEKRGLSKVTSTKPHFQTLRDQLTRQKTRIEQPMVEHMQLKTRLVSIRRTSSDIVKHRRLVKKKMTVILRSIPRSIRKTKETGTGATEGFFGGAGKGEIIPEFPEMVFEIGGGTGALRSGGPKIILFQDVKGDSYIGAFETLCLSIYRERNGGKPKATRITRIDAMTKSEINKWLEARGRIFTINLEKINEIDPSHLRDRLEETYSQDVGFIILRGEEGKILNELRSILLPLEWKGAHKPNIISVRARSLTSSLKKRISNLAWGGTQPEIQRGTFDQVFDSSRKKFEERLRRIREDKGALFDVATRRNRGQMEGKVGPESPIHYNIKVFLVKHLTSVLKEKGEKLRKAREIKERILTEQPWEGVIPDLRIDSEVYEVETLFGQGISPLSEIDEKLDQYEKVSKVKTVNIVLDNFTLLRHLRGLKNRLHHHTDKNFDIQIHTLNLENEQLISLKKVIKDARSLKKEIIATPK